MADLTSKLADSIKKSMSGFGAGMKSAFMSANPAGFGLAMKGIQSVMNAQATIQKKDFEQRQRDRQFAEENANEQKKITSDMLGTLHSIDDTLKKILQVSLNPTKIEEKSSLKKVLGAAAGGAAAGAKTASYLDMLKDILKGLKESLLNAFRKLAEFFSKLPETLMEGVRNLIKFFRELPGNLIEGIKNLATFFRELPGRLFKAFAEFFPETAKAIAKFVEEFKKFFRLDELGLWFAEKLAAFKKFFNIEELSLWFAEKFAKFKEFFKLEELSLWFAEKFAKFKEFFKLEEMSLWFAEKFAKLKEFFKLEEMSLWFAESFAKLKEFFKVEELGLWFAEKMNAIKNFFKIDEFALLLKGKIAELVLSFALQFGGIIESFGLAIRESELGKLVSSFFNIFDKLFTEIGAKLEPLKNFFSKTFEDIITKVKSIFGIGEEGAGIFARLAEQFPKLAKTFSTIGKIIPFLDIIIFALEGLFSAFDTEQIKKDLNVREVTVKDRVAAFLGGGIAAFTGGLIDAAFMISDWIFDSSLSEKSLKEGGQGTYQERVTKTITQFISDVQTQWGDYWSALKNVMSGNFDAAQKDMEHASLIDEAWGVRVQNFFGEIGVSIWNWLGEMGTSIGNVFGKLTNWIGNKIKGNETIGVIYDNISSVVTSVQNFVGKLFYDVSNVVENALYSAKKTFAAAAAKLGITIDVEAPKAQAAYVPYVAQKYSQNYKQTEYVPQTFQRAKWNTIANPAQDKLNAEKDTKNAAYDAANPPKSAPTVTAGSTAGSIAMGPSSLGGYNTDANSSDPLSVRNNNPGNLRWVPSLAKPGYVLEGAVQGEGGFAAFPTKEAGLAAMRKQMNLDTQTRGMTLAQFITKYAPPGDNNPTGEYISNMASALGISPGDRIPANKLDQLQAAMILQEGGPKSSSYFGTPSTGTLRASSQNNSGRSFGGNNTLNTSGIVGNDWASANQNNIGSDLYNTSYQTSSNVNSPDAVPTGTENKPIYTVSTEANPVDQVQQDKIDEAIQQQPVISQAQLDEMKRQQEYREKIDAENRKYQNERDNLEKQFRATLENNYRNQLTAAIPMGVTGAAATTNAGGNIANKYLSGPMQDLANQLFGKKTGQGVGQIFTQLAGSYGNQLISNVLAPALGMSGEQANRAFNNFAAGNTGMGWSDLLYGMTGISTDLRSAFGYESGINEFSKSLAGITAQPFSPLFNMGGDMSGVSPAEMSATNAGIIGQSAAKQNAQIQIAGASAAAREFVNGVGSATKKFEQGVGGTAGQQTGVLGTLMGALTGGGSATGGGTETYRYNQSTGNYDLIPASTSSNSNLGFLGNIGNMITGGRSRNPIAAGTDFIANLGGSFLGNKLGINTNSLSGVYAQTGINGILKSLLTVGGPGVMQTLANLAPGALLQRGVMGLGSMIGGASGTFIGDVGLGLSMPGLGAGANVLDAFAGSNVGIQAGSLLGAAGTMYGAVQLSHALSGGYQLDSGLRDVADAGVAIGSLFGPAGMFIAAGIGAAVNRMFGHGAPELQGMGIQGTIAASKAAGGSGTSLEGWKNIHEAGGTYTSDRNTFSTFGIPTTVADALMKDVDAQVKNMKVATTLMGMTTTGRFEDFTQFIKLDFQNKSLEEQQKMLTDTLKTFNDGMLDSVYPVFSHFKEAGESSVDAMNRMAKSTGVFNASWSMLGYSSVFNPGTTGTNDLYSNMSTYGVNANAGDMLTASFGGLNVDALRAAKIAADPAFADLYYNMKQVQTNVGSTHQEGGGMYSSSHTVADAPIYAMVRDGFNADKAKNLDLGLAGNFASNVMKSFGGGNEEAGRTAASTASQSYFSKYYSAKEQRDIALQAAKDKIAQIEKDTGATGLSGTDGTTKYQEKLANYRTQVEDAKAAMLADPTNQAKMDRYTSLMNNADAYAQSVQNIIGLSKAIANPVDAAAKNANLQASLDAIANKALVTGGVVSSSSIAGSDILGATSLGGYKVSQNVAAVIGGTGDSSVTVIPVYGTALPGTNGGMNVATTGGGASTGTLFAPTTYVDNTSNSTNVNAANGNDNVRDTYSHPILGSTERSVSSTYNYNYLYR